MAKVYNISETPLHIRKSLFDLSYSKMFTAQFGKLYPCYLEECLPGDLIKIKNEVMVRAQPMVAPLMHAVHIDTHYFWVPYRILGQILGAANPFITNLTGFENGVGYTDATKVHEYDMSGFRLTPGVNMFDDTKVADKTYNNDTERNANCLQSAANAMAKNTLWDFFGFPTGDNTWNSSNTSPLAFPWYAYNMVFNEYYRDQNLNNPVFRTNNAILTRAWDKDRFTSALVSAQRGAAPEIKTNINTSWAIGDYVENTSDEYFRVGSDDDYSGARWSFNSDVSPTASGIYFGSGKVAPISGTRENGNFNFAYNGSNYFAHDMQNASLSDDELLTPNDGLIAEDGDQFVIANLSAGLNINDLRLAMALQKWAEKTQRCGSRWTEYLRANFGTAPSDETVQKPVYLGGSKQPLMISEVRSTATTEVSGETTVVGDMAGHGLSAAQNYIAKWKAKEPGLIIGIMSIMPKSAYVSQGFNKKWLKEAREDWFNPMFCNLGEQPILSQELFFSPSDNADANKLVFGYQGIYDEYRSREDEITGNMRDTFSYWHLGRSFANRPALNPEFIACKPRNDVFAVNDEDPFIVDVHNIVKAVRPLPALSIPGGLA